MLATSHSFFVPARGRRLVPTDASLASKNGARSHHDDRELPRQTLRATAPRVEECCVVAAAFQHASCSFASPLHAELNEQRFEWRIQYFPRFRADRAIDAEKVRPLVGQRRIGDEQGVKLPIIAPPNVFK